MFRGSIFDRPFGSLFREMDEAFERMRRETDHWVQSALSNENGLTAGQPLVWGYHIETGRDGVPRLRTFGNAGQAKAQLQEGWREPFTTSFVDEEKDLLRITAEMPGVKKDQVEVEALLDRVLLTATGESWKYRKELPFSGIKLDPDSAEATYHNGILEVTVKLAQPVKPRGKQVKVR